jgi:hypothetical protein
MNATTHLSHRTADRKTHLSRRPVSEILLELAYRLHATKVVAQFPASSADWRPRKSR